MPQRRSLKTRESRILQLPKALAVFWLAALIILYMGGGLNGRNMTAVFLFVGLTIATPFSFWWAASALRAQNAAGKTIEEMKELRFDAFEEWVAVRFREKGYSVELTGTYGDHGIDLVAKKTGETAVIQCKKFRNWKVTEPMVRDLFGAMHDYGADRAFIVTTGQLTQPAADWLIGKPIEVWDGSYLARFSKIPSTVFTEPVVNVPAANLGAPN